jgi:hypothetical protein
VPLKLKDAIRRSRMRGPQENGAGPPADTGAEPVSSEERWRSNPSVSTGRFRRARGQSPRALMVGTASGA